MYISENCNWTPYGTNPELDKKVDSHYFDDRYKVVKQGYGLDKLINDKAYEVREVVAEQGYGLDILINDEDEGVRAAVARQGYGLDKLVNDEDKYVRREAKDYLKYNGYKSISDWAEANPDKVIIDLDINE